MAVNDVKLSSCFVFLKYFLAEFHKFYSSLRQNSIVPMVPSSVSEKSIIAMFSDFFVMNATVVIQFYTESQ